MGKGGNIVLINATPYNWILEDVQFDTMEHWGDTFGEGITKVISSNSSVEAYIEFKGNIFGDNHTGWGSATYRMDGTSYKFTIHAVATGIYSLNVTLDTFSTLSNPQGSKIELGFVVNEDVTFTIAGDSPATFTSTNGPSDWMQANLQILGPRPLQNICMISSHDAGMNKVTVSNPWASESNTLTQWLPVSGQLTAGARLFDIRPTLYQQTYATGHYSHAEILGWVGLSGQTMQEIVDQINAFLDVNHELVILRLWASQNINDSHRPFNQKEWDDLMALMAHPTAGLRHLFVANNPTQVDLKTLPLQTYIGNGKSAVVVQIQQFDVNIDAFASKGFYKDWQLQYYDVYSDTTDFQKMKDDQFKKMRDYCSANPIDKRVLFVLAWGLTLEGTQNIYGNIRNNGDYSNRQLFKVFPEVSKEVYPNLISIDSIRPGDLPALAMAINWKIKQ